MIIVWSEVAKNTFNDELEFIDRKWGASEVLKFIDLVDSYLETIKTGIFLGRKSENQNVYLCVISKQTSLVYSVSTKQDVVELLLV